MSDTEGLKGHYPLLVEAAVEYKKYSRRFMAEFKSKSSFNSIHLLFSELPYTESGTANRTSMMYGHTLQYRDNDKKYYCIKDGQTSKFALVFLNIAKHAIVEERLAILNSHMHKPDVAQH